MVKNNKKAFEIYRNFDEWVDAHKHSAVAVQLELDTHNEEINRYPPNGLESYIAGLEDLRSEIDSEISEARDWIKYFEKKIR
jgi:hypothetical protein